MGDEPVDPAVEQNRTEVDGDLGGFIGAKPTRVTSSSQGPAQIASQQAQRWRCLARPAGDGDHRACFGVIGHHDAVIG
jgi:hypothetical protein